MFENLFKIEERWGEKRSHQVLGAVLMVLVLGGMAGRLMGWW